MKTLEEKKLQEKFNEFEMEEKYDFTGGIRGRFTHPKKVPTTMRIDSDVLLYLKKKSGEKKISTLFFGSICKKRSSPPPPD
jgi:uncharacterized protein (DUF4415 family)